MKLVYLCHDQQESPLSRKNFLEMAGYEVELAPTVARLRVMLKKRKPDLLILDVLLDGPNGFEACREVRRKHAPRDLPIVLCTGIYRSRLYQEEAAAAGAQLYLLRPIKIDELATQVAHLLGGTAAAR